MRKDKTWTVDLFDHASVLGSFSIEQGQNDVFWTNDTEAYLNFKPNSDSFEFTEAELTMYNKNDGSLVILDSTDGVNVENNVVSYEMQPEVIAHFGNWTVQVRFIRADNESFTSGILEYEVKRALGDAIPEKLSAMKSWDTFFAHAQETIGLMEEAELTRVQAELDKQAQEEARETAEGERVANEEERISKDSERDSKIEVVEEAVEVATTNLFPYNEVLITKYTHGTPVRLTLIKNHKYYTRREYTPLKGVDNPVSGAVRLVTPTVELINGLSSAPNHVGVVMEYSGETRTNGIYLYGPNSADSEGNQEARYNDLIIIDLTEAFGVGNEPTAEQMDRLLEQFPNGWFEGTVNIYNSKYMMAMFFKELTKLNNAITTLGGNV